MSNPAELLGRMRTEKCPLNLATKKSLLILAREASRGEKGVAARLLGLRSE
jgi:hypothetical protein